MLTLEQCLKRLRDRKLSRVADAIGISRQGLYNIVNGQSMPSYETVKKLSDYLEGK